jgi:RNA polymerase-associated protein LEO1
VPSVDIARGDGEEVKVAKLSNIFGVATEAFDRETFVEETVEVVDADGISRVRMRDENVVRWRKNASTGEVESNARVVTWSDGSRQLVIGDEVLEMNERTVGANEEAYLYLRRPGLMQSQGRLASKLTFRPATLESRTHKRLTAAIDKKHGYRGQRTMEYVSNVDPEKEKEQADAELEKAQRESAALARKQQRMMREDRDRRYDASRPEAGYTENYYERRDDAGPTTTTTTTAAAARMDEDFLEADGDDDRAGGDADMGAADDDEEDDEDAEAGANEPKERRKRAFVESDSE